MGLVQGFTEPTASKIITSSLARKGLMTQTTAREKGGESEECEWITKTMNYYILAKVFKMLSNGSLGSTISTHN